MKRRRNNVYYFYAIRSQSQNSYRLICRIIHLTYNYGLFTDATIYVVFGTMYRMMSGGDVKPANFIQERY